MAFSRNEVWKIKKETNHDVQVVDQVSLRGNVPPGVGA